MWREHHGPRRPLRPWLTVLVAALIGGVLGLLVHAVVPTQYEATATVVVAPTSPATDFSVAVGYTRALGRIVADPAILEPAARASGIAVPDLQRTVRTQSSPDAPLVQVTATAPTADGAARAANSVTASFVSVLNARSGDTQVRLSTLTRAPVPPEPSGLSELRAALVGLVAGLLIGGLAVGVRAERRVRPAPRNDSVAAHDEAPSVSSQA